MKRIVLLLLLATSFFFRTEAQRLETFSENEGEFLAERGEYLTANKQEAMEDLSVQKWVV